MSNHTETSAHTTDNVRIVETAHTIKQQIGMWPLAEVGARQFIAGNFTLPSVDYKRPGLRFIAKPRHRLVAVYVVLDPSDTYSVIVHTSSSTKMPKFLYSVEGVYADSLAAVIRNLPKHI